MEILGNFGNEKLHKKKYVTFYCDICDYMTSRKSSFDKHILSLKHTNCNFGNNISKKLQKVAKSCKNNINNNNNCEICKKEFITVSGLWKHKQKCKVIETNNKINEIKEIKETDNNLIEFLINENKELKNMVMEVCKQIQPNYTTNNNTINSNNKTFNLQVFLNETCKDAMNITDFVNSIQLQLSDLENVGKVGYIEGISNIIIKNLKALDVEKRPVHCTDQKREVIYVKEDNIWEKEDETNKQLRKAIKLMAHKNICMLKSFRDKYPDFDDGDSKRSNQYNKIVIEAMGGKGDNEYEKDTKIIKKIAKVVGIEKYN
jgi:hypothetical protein